MLVYTLKGIVRNDDDVDDDDDDVAIHLPDCKQCLLHHL